MKTETLLAKCLAIAPVAALVFYVFVYPLVR